MPSQDPSSQIERVPLHEEVTNRLRDMIVSLRLPPGERIQELEVAQLLGVSRTPVREAIKVLTAEGLVELLPLRGAIVKAFSAKAESCCVSVNPPKIMQHMHGIIPYMFDCWADLVVHLLLLKSSMHIYTFFILSNM